MKRKTTEEVLRLGTLRKEGAQTFIWVLVSKSDARCDCGYLDKVVSVCYNWVNKNKIGGSYKMSTNKDYLNFLLDQLSSLEGITHRMMMGEYLIYYRGKVVAYICDDRFLVKPVPSAIRMLSDAEYDSISQGGRKKLLRVDNVDDRNFLTNLLNSMYDELPFPKSK